MLRIHRKPKMQSNHTSGYQKMAGDSTFSSPSRDALREDQSHYISPDTAEKQAIGPVFDSSISLIQRGGDGIGVVALFDEGSFDKLQLDVDHVSELFAKSDGSRVESSSSSLLKEELVAGERVDSPSPFQLASAVTSPSNRVLINESFRRRLTGHDSVAITEDETPKVANGMQLMAQSDVPNFSVIVSPISVARAKQEDHNMNVELSDWSFNVPAPVDDKTKTTSTPMKFEPESQWVEFNPFEPFGQCSNKTKDEAISFMTYVPDENNGDSSNKVSRQLEELNARLASVEHILRNIERQSQLGVEQSICDDEHSIAFLVDEVDVTNDDRTCTPIKDNLEAKSALFSRFFGHKKSQLVEI